MDPSAAGSRPDGDVTSSVSSAASSTCLQPTVNSTTTAAAVASSPFGASTKLATETTTDCIASVNSCASAAASVSSSCGQIISSKLFPHASASGTIMSRSCSSGTMIVNSCSNSSCHTCTCSEHTNTVSSSCVARAAPGSRLDVSSAAMAAAASIVDNSSSFCAHHLSVTRPTFSDVMNSSVLSCDVAIMSIISENKAGEEISIEPTGALEVCSGDHESSQEPLTDAGLGSARTSRLNVGSRVSGLLGGLGLGSAMIKPSSLGIRDKFSPTLRRRVASLGTTSEPGNDSDVSSIQATSTARDIRLHSMRHLEKLASYKRPHFRSGPLQAEAHPIREELTEEATSERETPLRSRARTKLASMCKFDGESKLVRPMDLVSMQSIKKLSALKKSITRTDAQQGGSIPSVNKADAMLNQTTRCIENAFLENYIPAEVIPVYDDDSLPECSLASDFLLPELLQPELNAPLLLSPCEEVILTCDDALTCNAASAGDDDDTLSRPRTPVASPPAAAPDSDASTSYVYAGKLSSWLPLPLLSPLRSC